METLILSIQTVYLALGYERFRQYFWCRVCGAHVSGAVWVCDHSLVGTRPPEEFNGLRSLALYGFMLTESNTR